MNRIEERKSWLGLPVILLSAAVAVSTGSVVLAAARSPTALEFALLQSISLALGIFGSYIFGKHSAREASRELLQPHARSAFRRLVSLSGGMSRLAQIIETSRASNHSSGTVILEVLHAMVIEQISTAADSLEDWRDVVPDAVAELEAKARDRTGSLESEE